MPKDLANFYLDLQDQRLETAICVFHQRFSTNTDPNWVLAQPFRMLAHNGEINTISGNRNSVRMRLSKLFRGKLKQFDFINKFPINTSGSDSRSLDNMLEMLVQGGKSVFDAIRLIIPPAWENDHALSPAVRAYHNFNALRLEAWDGPAGCVFTDGRYAVCLLDRNGLRPARWLHSKDGYVILSSEIGVDDCPAAKVIDKGRVGPGQIMAIDTKEHKILSSSEIDSHLAAAQPFTTWVHANVSELEVGDDFGAHPQRRRIAAGIEVRSLQPRRDQRRTTTNAPRRPRSRWLHGRRHPHRCTLVQASPVKRLLPPALRPGHQSRHRLLAREQRHELTHRAWAPIPHLWRFRPANPAPLAAQSGAIELAMAELTSTTARRPPTTIPRAPPRRRAVASLRPAHHARQRSPQPHPPCPGSSGAHQAQPLPQPARRRTIVARR